MTSLELLVDGVRHRPDAAGMPRPDLFAAEPRAFRSGFWGDGPGPGARRPGTVELALAARLADGSEHVAPLGRIAIAEREPAAAPGAPATPT